MTEPIVDLARNDADVWTPGPKRPRKINPAESSGAQRPCRTRGSADVGDPAAQELGDRRLGHAEGATEPDGGELPGVDHAVDGHLRHAHHRRHLGDGEETHVVETAGHDPPSGGRARARACPLQFFSSNQSRHMTVPKDSRTTPSSTFHHSMQPTEADRSS